MYGPRGAIVFKGHNPTIGARKRRKLLNRLRALKADRTRYKRNRKRKRKKARK